MSQDPEQPGLLDSAVYVTTEDSEGNLIRVLPQNVEPDVVYDHDLLIGESGKILRIDHGPLVARGRDLNEVSARSLSAAIRVPRCCCAGSDDDDPYLDQIIVVDTEGELNADYLPGQSPFVLEVASESVTAVLDDLYEHEPLESEYEYKKTLLPVIRGYGFDDIDVKYLSIDGTPFPDLLAPFAGSDPRNIALRHEMHEVKQNQSHLVQIRLTAEGCLPLRKLLSAANGLATFLAARRSGRFTARTVVDLLRAGHTQALLGQPENEFFEVKSHPYNTKAPSHAGTRQKIELAQDVARFANGDVDAIIVIGIKEGRHPKLSTLASVQLSCLDLEQYQAVLDERIVPAVSGLVIESVELGDGKGLVFIFVPRQPHELQPYLVHGAIVGDKIEGEFFSIVQRRGEGSITQTASQVHGYLVAGKAFLRGER